jgi:two-component system sensor histidine kinase ResE
VEALREDVVEERQDRLRYLDVALSEIQHLGRLVDDLFELTQLHAGVLTARREPSSLHDLVSDTLQALHLPAQEKGVSLEGEVAPDVDPVWMDSYLMQRALTNLVDNAVRHTPRGGRVRVQALRGERVEILVRDGGAGIPPEDLPHIFEAFYRGESSRFRGRGEGAGLGLSIARAVAEAHGGGIGVESGAGGGAVFRIVLPSGAAPGSG